MAELKLDHYITAISNVVKDNGKQREATTLSASLGVDRYSEWWLLVESGAEAVQCPSSRWCQR